MSLPLTDCNTPYLRQTFFWRSYYGWNECFLNIQQKMFNNDTGKYLFLAHNLSLMSDISKFPCEINQRVTKNETYLTSNLYLFVQSYCTFWYKFRIKERFNCLKRIKFSIHIQNKSPTLLIRWTWISWITIHF